MKENKKIGILAGTFANVFFGFSFLFTKMGQSVCDTMVLLAYRFTLAFLLFFIIKKVKHIHFEKENKKWIWILLLGIMQPTLYFICENYSIHYLPTSIVSVFIATIPIFTSIFSYLFFKEKVGLIQIIGMLIAIIGVILLAILGQNSFSFSIYGFILAFCAVLTASMFHILVRKVSHSSTSFERSFYMFLIAMISFWSVVLIYKRGNYESIILPLKEIKFWGAIVYLGIISSGLAFFLINVSDEKLPLFQSSILSTVSTIVSIVAGVIFLHEKFTLLSTIFVLMILIGILLSFFKKKEKE